MAATAINGIRLSKSGAKAGLVADGGCAVRDIDWRGRRLVQSAAKPNMRDETLRAQQKMFFRRVETLLN